MRALLINPWIHDFAAFDMWAGPLGLLYIASMLRRSGIDIDFLDCADRYHPLAVDARGVDGKWGTGKYHAEEIQKPAPIKWIKRKFKRYGIPIEKMREHFSNLQKPDVIFLSSKMTYWYTGVKEMAELCREYFPGTPVILGGIYATLMPEHARQNINPDYMITGEGESQIQPALETVLKKSVPVKQINPDNLDSYPMPAHDLYNNKNYASILTSRGCPMNCSYCASKLLNSRFRRRSIQSVMDEINYLRDEFKIDNIAFFDDALLHKPEEFIKPLLKKFLADTPGGIHFHMPNGLSCRDIDDELAELMKASGFESLRLSLETTNIDRLNSLKRENQPTDFLKAVRSLKKAGFQKGNIGVYILAGLPGQRAEEIDEAMQLSIDEGGFPRIAEYSPIPGTALWDEAVKAAKIDITNEPLYHNCSVYFYLIDSIYHDSINMLRRKYRNC